MSMKLTTTNEVSRQINEQTSQSISRSVPSNWPDWNWEHMDKSDLMPLLFQEVDQNKNLEPVRKQSREQKPSIFKKQQS